MGIGQHEHNIDWEGRRCIVSELGAKQARAVATRVMNTIGGAFREAGAAGSDTNVELVAIGGVLQRLTEADVEWFTATFQAVTKIERTPGEEDFVQPNAFPDLVFGGGEGLTRWFKWMAFCLELNVGPFIAAAKAEGAARQAAAIKRASQSPNTSTTHGGSTAS